MDLVTAAAFTPSQGTYSLSSGTAFLLSTLALREEEALPRHPWVGRLALGRCAGATKCGLGRVEWRALKAEDEHQRPQENPARQQQSP